MLGKWHPSSSKNLKNPTKADSKWSSKRQQKHFQYKLENGVCETQSWKIMQVHGWAVWNQCSKIEKAEGRIKKIRENPKFVVKAKSKQSNTN